MGLFLGFSRILSVYCSIVVYVFYVSNLLFEQFSFNLSDDFSGTYGQIFCQVFDKIFGKGFDQGFGEGKP